VTGGDKIDVVGTFVLQLQYDTRQFVGAQEPGRGFVKFLADLIILLFVVRYIDKRKSFEYHQ